MVEKKGALEVEVIRARGLVGKPGSKALPGNISSHTIITRKFHTSIINVDKLYGTQAVTFSLFSSQHHM